MKPNLFPDRSFLSLLRPSFALGVLLAAVSMAGCSTAARREIEAQRIQVHAEPLQLHAADGLPDAFIDTDGAVRIDHVPLPLDTRQRAATLAYREASLAVIDLALQAASTLTRFAIPRALFGLMVHGQDGAGRGIEADAGAIPHSPEFCLRLEHLLDAQTVAASRVPTLAPYVHLTRQDVESCRAGRPYHVNL